MREAEGLAELLLRGRGRNIDLVPEHGHRDFVHGGVLRLGVRKAMAAVAAMLTVVPVLARALVVALVPAVGVRVRTVVKATVAVPD